MDCIAAKLSFIDLRICREVCREWCMVFTDLLVRKRPTFVLEIGGSHLVPSNVLDPRMVSRLRVCASSCTLQDTQEIQRFFENYGYAVRDIQFQMATGLEQLLVTILKCNEFKELRRFSLTQVSEEFLEDIGTTFPQPLPVFKWARNLGYIRVEQTALCQGGLEVCHFSQKYLEFVQNLTLSSENLKEVRMPGHCMVSFSNNTCLQKLELTAVIHQDRCASSGVMSADNFQSRFMPNMVTALGQVNFKL